ncbi:MAG: MOSC domain-containing protein [Opitutaceae bacterium]|jgi:MOSC domain-containing protein YiiM
MLVTVERFYISSGHNFFGRRSLPAGPHSTHEPATLRCRAGWGIEGDRFYGYRPDYNGQITFFSAETLAGLREHFALPTLSAGVLRRNVLIGGVDLAALIGHRFILGGVSFAGTGEARPCHWMNHAVAPGAEEWLKGRGGLRARILNDGELALGPTEFTLAQKISKPDAPAGFIRERAVELRFEGGI